MKKKHTGWGKSLISICQLCKQEIEIQYDKYHCSILERKTIAEQERKNMPFPKIKTILCVHPCTNPCLFPDSDDCCNYDNGNCKVGHCVDEHFYDNN